MKAQVQNADEPIWQGSLHLGDEPGIYGDAAYAGLTVDLPVTLTPFQTSGPAPDIHFESFAKDVKVFAPYTGHKITIYSFAKPPTGSTTWTKTSAGSGVLDSDRAEVQVTAPGDGHYIVRVEVDTDLPPGLYNDFRLVGLRLMSTTHYADFGFRYLP